MLGGMLPDLIDKPWALWMPGWDTYSRALGHTLVFTLLLFVLSRAYEFAKPLAVGSSTHLALDLPWFYWQTFAWPLLGPAFAPGEGVGWDIFLRHLRSPRVGAGELVGGLVLLVVAVRHFLIWRGILRTPQTLVEERRWRLAERVRHERIRALAKAQPVQDAARDDTGPQPPAPDP